MRLNAEQMNWKNITPVLKKGIILENEGHHMDPNKVDLFANPISKIAFTSARSTKQMEIGQAASSGIIEQFKTGELFPDQIAGFSTKSILVALLVLMILKGR